MGQPGLGFESSRPGPLEKKDNPGNGLVVDNPSIKFFTNRPKKLPLVGKHSHQKARSAK